MRSDIPPRLQHSDDCFWVIDAQGRHLFTGNIARSILGYTREDLDRGLAIDTLIHDDDKGRVRESIAALMRTPERPLSVTVRLKDKSGAWRHCETTGVNMLHVEGVNGIVVTGRDIPGEPQRAVVPRRWLLVDDDEGVAASLTMALEDAGDHVEWIDRGTGFMDKVAAMEPDLILLDVELGDCDGTALRRQLRSIGSAVPVILMSGHALVAADELDAHSAFLAKPFEVAELLRVAARLSRPELRPSP